MHRIEIRRFAVTICVIGPLFLFLALFKGSVLGTAALILLGTVNDTASAKSQQ
jgi:hypothetical protein